jgi:hypothetical protein
VIEPTMTKEEEQGLQRSAAAIRTALESTDESRKVA